jgi:uncharacterized protein (TIGR03437 family)
VTPLVLLAVLGQTPAYTSAGIVNAASNAAGPLSPNTIATLYGTGLAFSTRAITGDDIRGNVLPTTLPNTGVRVFIAGLATHLYYVSPTQINFLVPSNLTPGTYDLELTLDGRRGPAVKVTLAGESPELFGGSAAGFVAATYPDGTAVTADRPSKAGDVVVIYATGLGRTNPDLPAGQLASGAAGILRAADFRCSLAGKLADPPLYVGLTGGFAGLYQVNLKIPEGTPADPEVRVGIGEPTSLGLKLPVRPNHNQ